MALICGDLTLVTCIEQLLGLDHFLCTLLMFYHADFYSKCSVVGPVPQQGPLELQVFALPCCSCSGNRSRGSAMAAWQVQCWQLTKNIEKHRILEAVKGDTLVTSLQSQWRLWPGCHRDPRMVRDRGARGLGASETPPGSNVGCCPQSLWLPWNPGAGGTAPGCGERRNWGKEQMWETDIKGASCV